MSRLLWFFFAALSTSASYAYAQANPALVPVQTLQAGETLSIDEEINISSNVTLQVSGGTIGQGTGGLAAPPSTANILHTHQTIRIVGLDTVAGTITVSTPGVDVVAPDQQPSTENHNLVCHVASHFDPTALIPTQDNDAVLEDTCEVLNRINGSTAFLNKARSATVSDNSNGAIVLLPLVLDIPIGTWKLSLTVGAAAANTFDLSIKDNGPTAPVWDGKLETNSSDDDVTGMLVSQTTGPLADKAPNGDVVNATVKTVERWHRLVVRQIPPPADPTPPHANPTPPH